MFGRWPIGVGVARWGSAPVPEGNSVKHKFNIVTEHACLRCWVAQCNVNRFGLQVLPSLPILAGNVGHPHNCPPDHQEAVSHSSGSGSIHHHGRLEDGARFFVLDGRGTVRIPDSVDLVLDLGRTKNEPN